MGWPPCGDLATRPSIPSAWSRNLTVRRPWTGNGLLGHWIIIIIILFSHIHLTLNKLTHYFPLFSQQQGLLELPVNLLFSFNHLHLLACAWLQIYDGEGLIVDYLRFLIFIFLLFTRDSRVKIQGWPSKIALTASPPCKTILKACSWRRPQAGYRKIKMQKKGLQR